MHTAGGQDRWKAQLRCSEVDSRHVCVLLRRQKPPVWLIQSEENECSFWEMCIFPSSSDGSLHSAFFSPMPNYLLSSCISPSSVLCCLTQSACYSIQTDSPLIQGTNLKSCFMREFHQPPLCVSVSYIPAETVGLFFFFLEEIWLLAWWRQCVVFCLEHVPQLPF